MIKKVTAITLIIFLSIGFLPGRLVWADQSNGTTATDPTPTPTPSPSDSPSPSSTPSPDPSASPTPTPTPAVQTSSVDPSPSPSPCPSSCPGGDVNQQNNAAVGNNVSSTSNTGGNTVGTRSDTQSNQATQSATVEASGSAQTSANNNGSGGNVSTGNATTGVNVVNAVNTNIAGSAYTFSIKNLYADANGNIDLTQLADGQLLPSAMVVVGNQSNNALVVNLIYASANSGQNSVLGTGNVQTGNAYSSVNLLNFINTNFFGSNIKFVVLNLFGNISGNIVLPDNLGASGQAQGQSQGQGGSGAVTQSNSANIQNNVVATSNSGSNNNGGGNTTTGNATTAVNVSNFANLNVFGGSFAQLLINNLGAWNGKFLGWGAAGPTDPVYGLMSFDFGPLGQGGAGGTCGCGDLTQSNSATLTNQVVSSANTGGNNTQNGFIKTGSAFSVVNILNFVNANFVNVKGFFGIINIFGTLNGDIGGASNFAATESQSQSQSQSQPDIHGPGGALTTAVSTNVGSHVNPGDTVTFFARARNSGTGPVYDTNVTFKLLAPDGSLASEQSFNIGKLDAGHVARISFGMTLAATAPAGTYTAEVDAQGKVGPNNDTVSSSSQTSFQVGLPYVSAFPTGNVVPDVLAASTVGGGDGGSGQSLNAADVASSVSWAGMLFFALGYLGMLYMAQRLLVKPWRIAVAYFSRPRRFSYPKATALASRLFSRFAAGAMALRHFLF